MRNRGRISDRYEDEVSTRGQLAAMLRRRPKDVVAVSIVAVGFTAIAINALFLQSGPHPAPIFLDGAAPPPAAAENREPARPLRSAETRRPAAEPAVMSTGSASKPAGKAASRSAPAQIVRHDPIAELLEPSNRIAGVQRALAEFGYGQIKPTGAITSETKAAIERFEREHKLPVTGQVTDRLTRELAAMKGGPL